MSHHVPAGPPRDRTRPRMAALLEIPDADRLSVRAVRGDPARPHRQAPGVHHRARLAPVGPHVPLPLRDPRAEFRAGLAEPSTRRLRRRDPLADRPDPVSTGRRAVSGLRFAVYSISL